MTGDGAVVREWEHRALCPASDTIFEKECTCGAGEHNALARHATALEAAVRVHVRHALAQAAEIERLTANTPSADEFEKTCQRLLASEARTADLLKALERAQQPQDYEP